MKKALAVVVILMLMLSGMPAGFQKSAAASLFTDVPEGIWYYKDLEYIVKDSRQILVGFAGKFGPLDNLTVEQFLKCVTVASGFVAQPIKPGEKWSLPYIEKAVGMKLVLSGEFTDYTRAITRAEMARIIIRSLPSITGETSVTYDSNTMKSRMLDYDSIPVKLQDDVCKAYQLGILTGGSDGKFNPNGSLQRASAVSAIRKLIDKSARVAVPVGNEKSEIWSDAEFEAFMRSGEIDDYMNIYKVVRIENRKIYWKSNLNPGQAVLIPEENNPGVNDMVYNLVKIMAYHTKKTDGYLGINYLDDSKGGKFFAKFYTGKYDYQYISNGAIEIYIHAKPRKSSTADKYFPGRQKGDTHYEWILGVIREKDAIEGYELGMDRTKFEWTSPRYEKIIKDMAIEVYGHQQGNAFFNFSLAELDEYFYTEDDYKASFIGIEHDIGCEVVYFTPEELISGMRISTDRPEVRK